MATSAMPAAAVTPTATAVFQRPPFMPAEPRMPATVRSARPHAHIGRRCPPDRSTAPLRCFPRRRRDPPPLVPSIDLGFRPPGILFFVLSAILAVWYRDFDEVVRACVTDRPGRVHGEHSSLVRHVMRRLNGAKPEQHVSDSFCSTIYCTPLETVFFNYNF